MCELCENWAVLMIFLFYDTVETPLSVGCRANSECPSDTACLNTRCVKPCDCGEHTECHVINHRPICTCLPGYQGNPNIGCYKGVNL